MPAVLWPNGSASIPRVTSEFNPARKNPVTGIVQPHQGIDLVGWSTIIAPASGVVTFAGYNGGAGNEVRIRADNGDVFRLLHNRELWARTGQRVSQGQGVAVMGTTGNSTGVHCHFETRPGGGNAINPRDYMASRNAGTTGSGSSQEDWNMATADQVLAEVRNITQLLVGSGSDIDNPNWSPGAHSIMGTVRNIGAHLYGGGPSAIDPEYFGGEGSVYNMLKVPVIRDGVLVSQLQDNANTNTMVRELLARPAAAVSDAQVRAIADAVVKQIGTPTVSIDYAAIAKSVNDDAARRLAS